MRYIKIPLIMIGIMLAGFILWYLAPEMVILPTRSSAHKLTIVLDGNPFPKQVVLTEFTNDTYVGEYILELKKGVYNQKPQKYELPKLNDGQLQVKLDTKNDGSFTVDYINSDELYERGLLIYIMADFHSTNAMDGSGSYCNRYIYFVSGEDTICYSKKEGEAEWSIITDAPKPRKFTKAEMGYSPFALDGQKENEWVYIEGNG